MKGNSSGDSDAVGTADDSVVAAQSTDGQQAGEERSAFDENRGTRFHSSRPFSSRLAALGLSALGIVAAAGGVAFPDVRQVLFALSATGLFGALLVYVFTTGRFVDVTVSDRIYDAAAANERALVDELELSDERIYVPTDEPGVARLFVPWQADYDLPAEPIESPDAVPTGSIGSHDAETSLQGVILEPTGDGLFREFERMLRPDLATAAQPLAVQLADGFVNGLELAGAIEPDVSQTEGRATITISDSAFGNVSRFDHPVVSFFGVGFANGLDRPVIFDGVTREDETKWLGTYRWNPDDEY